MEYLDIYRVYRTPEKGESNFPPSEVVPVHNLTLEELLRDYSNGIVHPMRPALYDDGEDLEERFEPTDIIDLKEATEVASPEPTPPAGQVGKLRADEEDEQREDDEEAK